MAGALAVVVVMVVVGPFLIFAGGAAWSAVLGSALDAYCRQRHPENEAGG
ncbi:MAG: hypothetical protein M3357_09965 [Actinomycetota bacterium]|jgi:hypothetical protein|nr:hypothetical protein [Actinomycetota bacterium]